LIKCAAKKIP